MPKNEPKQHPGKPYLIIFLLLFLARIAIVQIPPASPYLRHYYFLSRSFLQGKLDVTDQITTNFNTPAKLKAVFDYAIVNEKYFVYLGVFPSIFGIAFLPLGPEGYQTALVVFFLALIILILTRLIKHFLGKEALLIALLLTIGSPLLTTILWRGPWYLAGLMVSSLGLLFLWHYLIKKRLWSIILIIPMFLTIPTTIFYSLIPFIEIFTATKKRRQKLIILIFSTTTAFLIFTTYNYLRFGNPFEAGYKYAVVPQEEFVKFREKEVSAKDFLLSNVIYMFINPPRAHLNKALRFIFPYFELSRYGVGLLFTAPWLLPYLFCNPKKRQDWQYLLTAFVILITILYLTGGGSFQIGPRHACDFLPLLVFVNLKWLAKNRQKIPLFRKFLFLSFALNVYYFLLVTLGHMGRV